MPLVLQSLQGLQGTYGQAHATTDISQTDIISILKQYVEPTTHIEYTYTKTEAINLGIQDALIAMFGSVPSTKRAISVTQLTTLINDCLSRARNYYMQSQEVPDWTWPS